jgi:SM-20-related protein
MKSSGILDLDLLKGSLEECGHYIQRDVLPTSSLEKLTLLLKENIEADNFEQAGISRSLHQTTNTKIRDSKTLWINDWSDFKEVEILLTDIMLTLNQHFFLSMKRFESQLAWYQPGGFYKKHIDVHKETRHRQVTTILFLNNCIQGGELVLYDREEINKVDKVIVPEAGMLVTFFSAQVFHEVVETHQDRFSLTSWLRDDELLPFHAF